MKTAVASLSDQQLRSFRNAFNRFVEPGEASVAQEKFSQVMRLIGIIPTPPELEAMLLEIPGDSFNFTDLVIILYYFLRGADTTEELVRAFAIFDPDHDGLIPIETARHILINLKHPIPDHHVNELLARIRRDGDVVEYSEMIAQLRPS
jgi:Ca2+-binding EF-hand superfamily protein